MNQPVVLITGGTYGIGRAITTTLAARGMAVSACGLETVQPSSLAADAIPGLRAELAEAGRTALIAETDIAESAAVATLVKNTIARFGRIDALVNNAAIGPLGTVLDTDEALWDRIMAVNIKGVYLTCKAVLPHMIAAGGGRIVNIGSGAGHGKPNMAAYSASKGALFALSQAMAYDHFQQNIRVNVVVPGGGGIVTGMSLGRMGGDAAGFAAKPIPGTAAGRAATPEDVARVVAFLLSDDADVISGTVIDVGCFKDQGGPPPQQVRPV